MIKLSLLVNNLGLTNRVDGEKVYCGCGHEFTDIEGKWVCNGQIMCGNCHTALRARGGATCTAHIEGL